jgi:hypothetical protein
MPLGVRRLLDVYLNDHLAGATAGRELTARSLRSNSGDEVGRFLAKLLGEIEEDRDTLARVMERVGARPSRVKVSAAWAAEKVGRLKLNGRILGYSPLSRLVELEALSAGIAAKQCLWRSLERVAPSDARLAEFDFPALAERAERQRSELERHRREAALAALARER